MSRDSRKRLIEKIREGLKSPKSRRSSESTNEYINRTLEKEAIAYNKIYNQLVS